LYEKDRKCPIKEGRKPYEYRRCRGEDDRISPGKRQEF
jgi:hypothetical protein